MSEENLKVLEYTTPDIEPPVPDRVKIDIGGTVYTARCPTDFEFAELAATADSLEDGNLMAIQPVLRAFFDTTDARDITRRSRGSNATVTLASHLAPAIEALMDHYRPLVEQRLKTMTRKLNNPKGR